MRILLSYLLWPALLGACIGATALGLAAGQGYLVFNLAYLSLAAALFLLERVMPHEPAWLENCGQIGPDLGHALLNKSVVQVIVAVGTTFGLAEALSPESGTFWPSHWPLAAQVLFGLLLAEFGLYWAHRLAHEWPLLWRFHAVHHSATRLWFLNSGRFHFMDTTVSILLSQPLLFLAGAPKEVFVWVSAITAFIGMLTHCNVEMRFGPLSFLFNTPELHRWHHSMEPREGNKNYGENLMVFDHLFGSFFKADQRPPVVIGIKESMPRGFLGQLLVPLGLMRQAEQEGALVPVERRSR